MAYFVLASLFPSPVTPYTGLFVRHRLNALRESFSDNSAFFVVSPTLYFPFKHSCFKHYSIHAQKPNGITHYQEFDIVYPRFLQIPLTNSRFSGYFMYLSIRKYFDYFIKKYGMPKILIAEYGFPDGIAIYKLAKKHNLPYVITLRGSDMSYFMNLDDIRPQMITALNNAKSIVVVSIMMKQELHEKFSIPLKKITVIGNGVDNNIFRYTSNDIKTTYDIRTPYVITSVGGLIARKNHALAIQAMLHLPQHSLLIVGNGEEYHNLNTLIHSLNLKDRVKLLGAKPQETLAQIYSNSDLFLLCSLSEGRPNVVLEALACGTPVLTSAVQGVDELITDDTYGTIMNMIDLPPSQLSEQILTMTNKKFDREAIQRHGHQFSWNISAQHYKNILLSA